MLQHLTAWQREVSQVQLAGQLKLNQLRVLICNAVDVPDLILKLGSRISSRVGAACEVDSIKELFAGADARDLGLQWVVKHQQRRDATVGISHAHGWAWDGALGGQLKSLGFNRIRRIGNLELKTIS
jgi:hypothetical protein